MKSFLNNNIKILSILQAKLGCYMQSGGSHEAEEEEGQCWCLKKYTFGIQLCGVGKWALQPWNGLEPTRSTWVASSLHTPRNSHMWLNATAFVLERHSLESLKYK